MTFPRHRRFAAVGRPLNWLLALALGSAVAACTSLPAVDNDTSTKATPNIATSSGMLTPKQSAALVAKRWASAGTDLKALAALEEEATGVPLIAGNKVTLLFDGPASMREMMAAARAATNSINLESYIFDQDELGNEFADLLIEKQRQGVQVNVIYDAVGNLGTPRAFFDRMRAGGIHLVVFNPVNPVNAKGSWDINNRDHRKLLVVDGRIAFTGGINISSTYSTSSLFRSRRKSELIQEAMKHKDGGAASHTVGWRDTEIKVEGPAVAAMQWSFVNTWTQQGGDELPQADYFPKLDRAGDKIVRVLSSAPGGNSDIYKSLVLAMNEAKKSIHLTAAYFVPDQQIVDALVDAAKRGVDVKLVLPGVSDHSLVRYAGQDFYEQLLKGGVHIFELQIAVLHAKTAVIDSSWATIGSANIDRRSFIHNYELNVVVLDPAFGRDMDSAFNEDLRDSKEVTLERWKHRPWSDRIKEWMSRLGEYWI